MNGCAIIYKKHVLFLPGLDITIDAGRVVNNAYFNNSQTSDDDILV